MGNNKNKHKEVWVGGEELINDPAFIESANKEFVELPVVEQLSDERSMKVSANRRDFLKYLGFSVGAATVAASCDIPVKKALPYVTKPDSIVPGIATYYASSFVNGGDYCSVLVKTREGRPIKIEGNRLSGVTKGGTSARAQASVLSLYDTSRFQQPQKKVDGAWQAVSWDDMDKDIMAKLGPNPRIVMNTNMSPTAKKTIAEFQAKYPGAKVVTYDPVSSSAILEANEQSFGMKTIPNYRFDAAEVIVSFGADFLGTWISPVEYARDYSEHRKIKDVKGAKMSRHIQVESAMTLTGSNADNRILVKPSEMGAAIATLFNEIARASQSPTISAPKVNDKAGAALAKLAKELLAHKGKCLVVSGSNNVGEQVLVNAINTMLDSYGKTIRFANASNQRQGIDREIQGLLKEMEGGSVSSLIFWGANPAFDLPNAEQFAAAMAKVPLKVSMSGTPDETTALCDYVAPASHYLESWGDVEPKKGYYSLIQPTISNLFDTRQAEASLLTWAGNNTPYHDYLKANWEATIFPKQNDFVLFQAFWDSVLHDGVFEMPETEPEVAFNGNITEAAGKISKPASGLEVAFFETVNVGAGQYAGNPWLQEMPDPITRCVWGNYLAIPIEFDGDRHFDGAGPFKGLNNKEIYGFADKINMTVGGKTETVTCIRQFGLAPDVVSLALGYGRKEVNQTGKNVGNNVFPWLSMDANGNTQYYATGVEVSGKVAEDELACVQYHHTMGIQGEANGYEGKANIDELALGRIARGYEGALVNRTVIRQGTLDEVDALVEKLHEEREEAEHLNSQTLYPYDEYKEKFYDQGHHWGIHVDMNACIGCGACQVACLSENNVPVVGKYEVFRHHEMTWLRIDRYFYGDVENPSVVYQPMMCQHCDNAPCENVCPVSATVHNSEGLNQMAYNRCIGTRYCANNCPYKVRRFNWLDYTTADLFPINEPEINGEDLAFGADNLTRMVLNPDVTVRSRGVMEKCSFCVQRIQEGKLAAKREGRLLRDGDVKSACQTACPTGAITFGDMNDENSAVVKAMNHDLTYFVLDEINTRPSVKYRAKVTNKDKALS
ncbi:MAG: 4Fe-4S dicluster domain-containing protein [Bacteroidetes bacterium]|nr:MAG: 4Fe-4S dicluster domain-containing protein [Bacteroidota bacterium]